MGHLSTGAVAALTALALLAAPAQAGEVIVVDGGHAERVSDPAVPERGEIRLPAPPASVRAAAARGEPRPPARVASRRGNLAVSRALGAQRRAGRISAAQVRRWGRSYVRAVRALAVLGGARDTELRYVVGSVEA